MFLQWARRKTFDGLIYKLLFYPRKGKEKLKWAQIQVCKPYYKAMQEKKCHGMVQAMTSYLEPVRWQLKSRLAKSREWKPCSSRFQSAFHKEYGLLSFPKCYKRKNNISRVRHHTERRCRGGLRQRSSRDLEIDSSIIILICLVLFSLYFSWILS